MTDPHRLVDELVTELPGWLPTQRWFAGKDRAIDAVRPLGLTVLLDGDPLLASAQSLRSMRVLQTWIAGVRVFDTGAPVEEREVNGR